MLEEENDRKIEPEIESDFKETLKGMFSKENSSMLFQAIFTLVIGAADYFVGVNAFSVLTPLLVIAMMPLNSAISKMKAHYERRIEFWKNAYDEERLLRRDLESKAGKNPEPLKPLPPEPEYDLGDMMGETALDLLVKAGLPRAFAMNVIEAIPGVDLPEETSTNEESEEIEDSE